MSLAKYQQLQSGDCKKKKTNFSTLLYLGQVTLVPWLSNQAIAGIMDANNHPVYGTTDVTDPQIYSCVSLPGRVIFPFNDPWDIPSKKSLFFD